MKYRITYMLNYGAGEQKKYCEYKYVSTIDANNIETAHSIAKDVMNTMRNKNTNLDIDHYQIKEQA